MLVRAAFCRLVLGEDVASDEAEPEDRVAAVASGWAACAPVLARRGAALSWEEPDAEAGLAALPDRERAAVAAQALGLAPAEVERALGEEPGAAAGLLARAHAALAGVGLPADDGAARERERLAVAPRPRAGRRSSPDARAFAAAVVAQRAQLGAAAQAAGPGAAAQAAGPGAVAQAAGPGDRPAEVAVGPGDRPAGVAVGLGDSPAEVPVGPGDRPAEVSVGPVHQDDTEDRPRAPRHRASVLRGRGRAPARDRPASRPHATLLEPRAAPARAAVAAGVLLASGAVGFLAVSGLERDDPPSRPGAVTATPVGPLPPGVGPTAP